MVKTAPWPPVRTLHPLILELIHNTDPGETSYYLATDPTYQKFSSKFLLKTSPKAVAVSFISLVDTRLGELGVFHMYLLTGMLISRSRMFCKGLESCKSR